MSTVLDKYLPTECILSSNELEHIFLCHPRFGESVRRDGVRWFADDTVLQQHYDYLTLPCRGRCNIQKAIDMVSNSGLVIPVPDMRTLRIGQERFAITALVGECPTCKVVHAARSLPT